MACCTSEAAATASMVSLSRLTIAGGVPAGTTIALKNGWLPVGTSGWQVDSIGWIRGHGRDYVLAVLASANPTEQYGIDTIETIARSVYQSRPGG